MSTFARAWGLLKDRIAEKTSWGYLEVRNLMFECLQTAALEQDREDTSDE